MPRSSDPSSSSSSTQAPKASGARGTGAAALEDSLPVTAADESRPTKRKGAVGVLSEEEDEDEKRVVPAAKKKKRKKTKTKKPGVRERGIVYLASVPPFMRVEKLRHLLSQFGAAVNRIFLAAEDPADRQRRKKAGGNRKQKYLEGWVEFEDKRIAKRVAWSLNNTPIGGKKRNYYRDDRWNMRYLSKFKWHQLKEDEVYTRHVRKARLDQQISRARRENEFYMEKVDEAARIRKIADKRAAKNRQESFGEEVGVPGAKGVGRDLVTAQAGTKRRAEEEENEGSAASGLELPKQKKKKQWEKDDRGQAPEEKRGVLAMRERTGAISWEQKKPRALGGTTMESKRARRDKGSAAPSAEGGDIGVSVLARLF